jgi:hypothetical protein
MRLTRLLGAIAVALLVPVLTASPASATINGPCTASGKISATTYDASRASVKIPRTGDVHWKGAINTGGSGKRQIEGKVYIKLPPPFGRIQVAGSWDGPSSRYANSGTYHYDMPSVLVGPKFTVFGHHAERGTVVCTGSISVQLSGSPIKNPVLLASLVLTVLAVINFLLILRVKAP